MTSREPQRPPRIVIVGGGFAGAYAAQGEGGRYVVEIEGSFTNVVGLPLVELRRLLLLSGCRVPLPDMHL